MEPASRQLQIPLQQTPGERPPPSWARGAPDPPPLSYFANRYGEQWVATTIARTLVIAGSDIGWQEIHLTEAEAHAAGRRAQTVLAQSGPSAAIPVHGYLFGRDEARWLTAVIGAAFPR